MTYSGSYNDGSAFLKGGYVFTGWNTKADGTGDWYPACGSVERGTAITLYAQWEQKPSDCWIRYCENSTGIFDGKSYIYEAINEFPANVQLMNMPASDDYYPIGWGVSSSGRTGVEPLIYAPGNTIEINENTTLYAWCIPE